MTQQTSRYKKVNIEETLEQRGKRYGHFEVHAGIAQKVQNAMRINRQWEKLPDIHKQALTTIADKIARILSGDPNYIDNWSDIAGYATLVSNLLSETDGATDVLLQNMILINGEWMVHDDKYQNDA